MTDSRDIRGTDEPADQPPSVTGTFDWSETEPTVAVVETVAVASDRSPLDVSSLHDAIDTEALNRILRSGTDPEADLQVTFSFAECVVTVHGDGRVGVELPD